MYHLKHIGPALNFVMNNPANDSPQALRERAERALRLAAATTDTSAHDALTLYGQELLAEADRIEGAPWKRDNSPS